MLETILPFIRNTNTHVALPKWELQLQYLQRQKEELRTRYLNAELMLSSGARVLRRMLGNVDQDFEYLLTLPSDIDRYLDWFLPMSQVTSKYFDPVAKGKPYYGMFYKSSIVRTQELICSTDNIDHLRILPMDLPWSAWEPIRPVHLWGHRSSEYTLNILKGHIEYKYDPPYYTMVFVDTISLMFKYFKYLQRAQIEQRSTDPASFIQKYVMGNFLDDLQDVWVIDRFLTCIELNDIEEREEFLKVIPLSNQHYGRLGSSYIPAMREMCEKLDLVRKNSIQVQTLLASKILYQGSLLDRVNYTLEYQNISYLSQLDYVRVLRDLPLVEAIVKTYQWKSDMSSYQQLARTLRTYVMRLQSRNIVSRVRDTYLKILITEKLDALNESLKL
jgi:hypothetical protein